jgi:hypothetical protein
MFIHSDNDLEITDYLSDMGFPLTPLDADRVTSFYVGTSYHLLLFFSKEGDKEFHLFTAENFKFNLPDLEALKEYLSKLFNSTGIEMFKVAVEQVEIQITSVRTVQMFAMK